MMILLGFVGLTFLRFNRAAHISRIPNSEVLPECGRREDECGSSTGRRGRSRVFLRSRPVLRQEARKARFVTQNASRLRCVTPILLKIEGRLKNSHETQSHPFFSISRDISFGSNTGLTSYCDQSLVTILPALSKDSQRAVPGYGTGQANPALSSRIF